jgi:uncharacterized protein (DUF1697 family)
MRRWIALLRGINVGGNKKVPMAALKTLCESLGYQRVTTLLQSGNVVLNAETDAADEIVTALEAGIERTFGFSSSVIVRSGDAWRAIIDHSPYTPAQLETPDKLLLMLLRTAPTPESLAALRQAHSGTEIMHLNGRELYIYFPDGMGRSKLDNGLIERKLKVVGTGRNWNTVNKLLALVEAD